MTKKLLVIDDQAGVARAVQRIAADLGYQTKILTSPERAIDLFVDYQPDVVMLDMIMPEKDGIDVLHEMLLTEIPTRLVLTSGLSNGYLKLAEQVARFHGGAQVSVLRKPFRRKELEAVLRETTEPRTRVLESEAFA